MKRNWLQVFTGMLALAFIAAFYSPSQAAPPYPSRDITVIITWGAGGTSDLSCRQLADPMGKILGKTIIPLNVVGGSGAIGMNQGAHARADGYTITFVTSGPTVIQPWVQKVTYDPTKDFIPVAQVFGEYLVVVAKSDAPYKNLKEMADYFKKIGKSPKFATPGAGSNNHLSMVLLSKAIGIPMTHVPFSSSAEGVNAVIGGNVDIASTEPPSAVGPAKEGRAHILAILSASRLDLLREVPTVKEQGYDLVFGGWNGILVPKGTPKEVVDKLADAAKRALENETLIKNSAIVGRPIEFLSGPEFGERIKKELARNGEIIKAEGLAVK
ncbi:MAG TPA: tripartite tricarboxylate transporter substrate binding protein [Thermodesulfobacteriota bacterium]|nr:tripartite tricarboxylate transporter substrate binding protein [Thermodesulfobacteriota bacterium]